MPLARIITRAVEESQELAADLRGRGFEVEIVSPFSVPTTRADLELRLEECTPEEALIRAGVLPETNDMAVFIAPGAIVNRRVGVRTPVEPQFPAQRKWYDSLPDATTVPPEVLPFEMKPLSERAEQPEQVKMPAIASESLSEVSALSEGQTAIHNESVSAESVDHRIKDRETADRQDEPIFSAVAMEAPVVLPEPKPKKWVVRASQELISANPPTHEMHVASKPATFSGSESKKAVLPAPKKIQSAVPVRRVRIPALAGNSPWAKSKAVAGFAAVAVLILVLGSWVFKKAPAPGELASRAALESKVQASTADDAHQALPFSEAKGRRVTPPIQAARAAAKPVETASSSLVPQAAAAVTPPVSPKRSSGQKRVAARSGGNENVVAKDTVTRFRSQAAKAQPTAKPKTTQPDSDGIKRYSDLD